MKTQPMSDHTPDLQRVLEHYISCGWVDVSHGIGDEAAGLRPAYLLLTSLGTTIQPLSEVQVTARCYRPFRAYKMVVAEDSGRFDLIDLKISYRSQFVRDQALSLREHVYLVMGSRAEVQPDLIRWPLESCLYGAEVSVRAIIPDSREEDPGAKFEIVLLGEAVS